MKAVAGLIGIFIVLPIWYYLLFKILKSVEATELMWFLFWVYIPLGIFTQVVAKLTEPPK